jgi:hypothetical protein
VTSLSTAQLAAIAAVACPVHSCHAPAGTPCGGMDSPRRAPHPERVDFADRRRRELFRLESRNKACH